MNILIIPSAKVINEELQSRYGKIVPILIPTQDGIVLDKIYNGYEKYYDEIIVTLYEEFDNTLNIINSKNYSKLKVKKLSQLKDIGFGVYEVLKEYTGKIINRVSINFGDIYVEEIAEDLSKNIFYYSESLERDRWAIFNEESSKININEKLNYKMENKREKILIGFFNFLNFDLFFTFLSKICIKSDGGESLYKSLENYSLYEKVEYNFKEKWIDFGHLDNFLQAQKMVETRFFNEITIDRNKNILTKKSNEKEKLINEIKWFLTLPTELQWITPRIYSYSLDWENPSVSMEYYSYPTLHHLYLYGNHNLDKWKQIFNKGSVTTNG